MVKKTGVSRPSSSRAAPPDGRPPCPGSARRLAGALCLLVAAALASGQARGGEQVPARGAGGAGRICVARLPKNAAEIDRDPARKKARREYAYQFTVKVGDRDWVEVPREEGVLIQDLPTGQRHTVTIRDGDRVIESFPFTFEEKESTELCLSYTPWYQTWRLDAPRPKAWWCKCETAGR